MLRYCWLLQGKSRVGGERSIGVRKDQDLELSHLFITKSLKTLYSPQRSLAKEKGTELMDLNFIKCNSLYLPPFPDVLIAFWSKNTLMHYFRKKNSLRPCIKSWPQKKCTLILKKSQLITKLKTSSENDFHKIQWWI